MKYTLVFVLLPQILTATQSTQPSLLERITHLEEEHRKREQELAVCASCSHHRAKEFSALVDEASKIFDKMVAVLESSQPKNDFTLTPAELVNQEKLCKEQFDTLEKRTQKLAARLSPIALKRSQELMMEHSNDTQKTVIDIIRQERKQCLENVQKHNERCHAAGKAIAKELAKEDSYFGGVKSYLIDKC